MTTKINPRALALDIITDIHEEGAFANLSLDKALLSCPDLDPRDKGLITELVYGSIKYRGRLDHIIDQFAKIKTAKMDPTSRNILRLGVYQLLFLDRIPPSAAVNESVKLAKSSGYPGSDKFINGILRAIERGRDEIRYPNKGKQPASYMAAYYSFPQWLIEHWSKTYGRARCEAFCQYFNAPAPLWVRTNTLKTTRDALLAALAERGIDTMASLAIPEGICILSPVNLHALDLFQAGHFIIQDLSSMHVAHVLDPQPGERILDVCSAPGGKTTHIAQLMGDEGEIIACDIHDHRLGLTQENAQRLGITTINTLAQDGTALAPDEVGMFDRILVDAPCSGLGVLNRRADARWKKRRSDIPELQSLQLAILSAAQACLKPGGRLVYSTCTTTAAENDDVIAMFLADHPDFALTPPASGTMAAALLGEASMRQFLPDQDEMDGFFITSLSKAGGGR